MSNIVDRVFAEVCLDERITDGIFRMDEEQHMDALRDYFLKKGITQEAAVAVTNRMVEGKYPDRQAWRVEDGILVTWPSPAHKTKAMKENPGKYTEREPTKPRPRPTEPADNRPPPPKDIGGRDKEEDEDEGPKEPKGAPVFPQSTQDGSGKELEVEPPRGDKAPEPPPAPTVPVEPTAPRTPERIAAEKEVAKQIMNTSDDALTKIEPQVSEACQQQLTELLKHADKQGYDEAVRFLIKYVKI